MSPLERMQNPRRGRDAAAGLRIGIPAGRELDLEFQPGGSVGMGLWPSLCWGDQDISGVPGLCPPVAAARPAEVFPSSGWGGQGRGEGIRTKLLFFSLFPLSLPLTTFFRLFFSPSPSIPLSRMIFSRTTCAGPVSAAAPEGTLGRKRRRGVSVPVLPSFLPAGCSHFSSTSCPGGGGMCFGGFSFLHGGGAAAGGLSTSQRARGVYIGSSFMWFF